MKRTVISTLIIAISGAPAFASDFVDTAKVVSSTPIIERVSEPRQECWNETVNTPAQAQDRGIAGPLIGGVAGALLGSQVGKGNGKTAATAGGAIVGAIVGDRVGNAPSQATSQPVQRCRTVESTHEVIKGYSVVYRYNGHNVSTTLPYNPGSTVKVGVGLIEEGNATVSDYNNPPQQYRY